jgi:hypothetical protein
VKSLPLRVHTLTRIRRAIIAAIVCFVAIVAGGKLGFVSKFEPLGNPRPWLEVGAQLPVYALFSAAVGLLVFLWPWHK